MNILVEIVEDAPHARIADFGIAIVTKNLDSARPATYQGHHTPTWSAPEVLSGENPSKESDVYSFGMIMVEVYVAGFVRCFRIDRCCMNKGTLWGGSLQRSEN